MFGVAAIQALALAQQDSVKRAPLFVQAILHLSEGSVYAAEDLVAMIMRAESTAIDEVEESFLADLMPWINNLCRWPVQPGASIRLDRPPRKREA